MLTKKTVAEEVIKFADTTINSGIQSPIQFHGKGTGVLTVSSHTSNDYFELAYVVLDELSTILHRVENLLTGTDKG